NCPNRRSSARAGCSVTVETVQNSRHQYKYQNPERRVRQFGLNKVVLVVRRSSLVASRLSTHDKRLTTTPSSLDSCRDVFLDRGHRAVHIRVRVVEVRGEAEAGTVLSAACRAADPILLIERRR